MRIGAGAGGTLSFVEDLPQAHRMFGIQPDGHLGKQPQHIRVFGHQFKLIGLDAIHHFLAQVLDLPFFVQLLAARPKPQQQVALVFCRVHYAGLVQQRLKQHHLTAGVGQVLRHGLSVHFSYVRRHLEAVAVALVVGHALLNVLIVDGHGVNGVELEVR